MAGAGRSAYELPTRKGFGTTIIDRSVPYDLGSSATIAYAPDGVSARFQIPRRHVSQSTGPQPLVVKYARPSPGHPVKAPTKFLVGHRILLVAEDSLIIALDAEDILTRLGAEVLTASTVEGALELMDGQRSTLRLHDIDLGDQTSLTVADRLGDLGIPFLFATGYGEQAVLPEFHRRRTVVQKPYTLEGIARALEGLIG